MASFTIAVALVVILTYVSCGNAMNDKSPELTLIQYMLSWLKTNLTNFTPSVDNKHQFMATAIASKLHREQAELKGAVVSVVDGGGIWLLIFPNITIARTEMGDLSKEEKLIKESLVPEMSALNKIVKQGILGGSTVASFSKGVLKMCSVIVTANIFLHDHQENFIQRNKSVVKDWNKYLNVDRLKNLPSNRLLPMTARAVLEGINYAEQHNGTGKGPVLAKIIQDNIINRTIIFDGKVDTNNYSILEPESKKGSSVFDIKLDWIRCGRKTQPSYAIVNCENGRFFIVGSCTEPRKRFQATFSASMGKQEPISSKAEERDLQLNHSRIQPTDRKQTQVDLVSWNTTTETDHGPQADNAVVITNPNPELDKDISSNQNPGLPIDSPSLEDITHDDLLSSKPHTTQGTPMTIDVTDKLAKLVQMISRPAQPDVIANGNTHILHRNEYLEHQIPATPGALFTAILTVQLGMERLDCKKYRLIRIQDADSSIELPEIRRQAMYNSKKIFGTRDEKEYWVVKDTPVNPEEFQVAVDDGLFMFTETIFATGKGSGDINNDVSRYLAYLMSKEGPIYCGAAAQAFCKKDRPGDMVQLIIQFSE